MKTTIPVQLLALAASAFAGVHTDEDAPLQPRVLLVPLKVRHSQPGVLQHQLLHTVRGPAFARVALFTDEPVHLIAGAITPLDPQPRSELPDDDDDLNSPMF
jgi:hypothetical protein